MQADEAAGMIENEKEDDRFKRRVSRNRLPLQPYT